MGFAFSRCRNKVAETQLPCTSLPGEIFWSVEVYLRTYVRKGESDTYMIVRESNLLSQQLSESLLT